MDWSGIIVGVLAFLGTTVGSLAGIRASNRVVDLRLRSLEEKVSKHNNLVERMYGAEQKLALHDEQLKVASHRIGDLEKEER